MFLQSWKITKTMPSIVRDDWMGVWAELSNDVREVLPYLNAVVKEAAYNPKIPNLSFRWKENVLTIGPRAINIAQAPSEKEAMKILDELKDYINETWEKRETITPIYERREELKAGDILKLLPQTNCRECGLPTCFAFAMALSKGQKHLKDCPPLSQPAFAKKRDALVNLLRSAGLEDMVN